MSKLLQAMLFPFMHKFQFGDGDAPAVDSNEIVFDTSDPKPESEQAKPETPPVAENAEAANAEPAKADEPTEKPSAPEAEKTFTQAELDAIVQKRLNKLERKLTQQIHDVAKPEPVAVPTSKPQIEDFTDYADYVEALTEFKAKEIIQGERQREVDERNRQSYESENERKEVLQTELMEKGNDKYTDFDDVARKTGEHLKSKGLSFSQAMLGALLETSNAHDIVYHLGTDLNDAARIAALPAYAQAKEIGKLEDKLSAKAPPKPSSAPAPATPIHSGKSTAKSYEDMTTEEYTADARRRGAAWAR
jgi:hypothetical protein